MRNKKLLRITRVSVFTALALIMHFLEGMLPPVMPFAPGAKMGLSNVVTLIALIVLGYPDAIIIQVIRCVLGSVFSNPFSIVFSLPAGLLSLLVMLLMYHFFAGKISVMAISFAGAVIHNITQSVVAVILNNQIAVLGLLPMMLLASLIAGLFVGIVVFFVVKNLPERIYK